MKRALIPGQMVFQSAWLGDAWLVAFFAQASQREPGDIPCYQSRPDGDEITIDQRGRRGFLDREMRSLMKTCHLVAPPFTSGCPTRATADVALQKSLAMADEETCYRLLELAS